MFCSHDWESIVLKSAIHETKIRTTNEKQGCKSECSYKRVHWMHGSYKQKKGTNYVSGKKQVVTFEKTYSPSKQKRPTTATKSRLFEYEKTHKAEN